ncbi:hypothetical protein D1BOALGB6SA_8922 [Olavius sp. associated proteobacterium Delta 1]|nr:hypothetical protein D1BOALGB6SA_8922 [Olavius sp. associated proteobacterium Delta 1]
MGRSKIRIFPFSPINHSTNQLNMTIEIKTKEDLSFFPIN